MRLKRLLAGIIASVAALCFAGSYGCEGILPVFSVTAGAEAVTGGGIGVSSLDVRNNEQFEVTVTVPALPELADTSTLRVEFDPSAFEVVSWAPTISGAGLMVNYSNEKGFFLFASASAKRNIDLSGGGSFTAVMRVKNTAEKGSYEFNLKMASFSYIVDSGITSIQLWKPSVTRVSVNVIAVPVSGKITVTGTGGTATVTLRDGNGNAVNGMQTLLAYNSASGAYEGSYYFPNAYDGYTVEVSLDGCPMRTLTVGLNPLSEIKLNIYGDIDGNGKIEAVDATQILRYIVGMTSWIKGEDGVINEYLLSVANVKRGGELSEKDATLILRHIAGLTSIFDSI